MNGPSGLDARPTGFEGLISEEKAKQTIGEGSHVNGLRQL
jgi:hypothetical protein